MIIRESAQLERVAQIKETKIALKTALRDLKLKNLRRIRKVQNEELVTVINLFNCLLAYQADLCL